MTYISQLQRVCMRVECICGRGMVCVIACVCVYRVSVMMYLVCAYVVVCCVFLSSHL